MESARGRPAAEDGTTVESGGSVTPVTPNGLLDAFESADPPLLTAAEVAERAGCSGGAARAGLGALVDRGQLHRKAVDPDSTVFLLSESGADGSRR
ncbi:helix-turn-helix domain-containing protein [Halobium salinum]|uniref:Helix-turn-helix domain-containing protein n=1 Tax=Halobium salinum TaxID=1364940 RepID=A0ABD5PCZ9_9EURY|nr:helix-turn-helix domain-containing protein [Halobium salinum]